MLSQASAAFLAAESPRFEHVGFVVRSVTDAAKFYRDVLGCPVTEREERAGQGIAKIYVTVGTLQIELIEPTTEQSPIKDILGDCNASDYLRAHPGGGIHHVCYSVVDLAETRRRLTVSGYRVLGNPKPNESLVFLDPSTTGGAIIELKARN